MINKFFGFIALMLVRVVILGLVAIWAGLGLLICFPVIFSGDQDDGQTGYQD